MGGELAARDRPVTCVWSRSPGCSVIHSGCPERFQRYSVQVDPGRDAVGGQAVPGLSVTVQVVGAGTRLDVATGGEVPAVLREVPLDRVVGASTLAVPEAGQDDLCSYSSAGGAVIDVWNNVGLSTIIPLLRRARRTGRLSSPRPTGRSSFTTVGDR